MLNAVLPMIVCRIWLYSLVSRFLWELSLVRFFKLVVSVTLTSWTGTLIETEQSDLVILSKIDEYKKLMPNKTDSLFDDFKYALDNLVEEPVIKKSRKKVKEGLSLSNYIKESLCNQ